MTHAQLTDAVRAAENLAPSSAERHGTYANRSTSRTGDHARPTDEGRVSAVPSRTTPSHARPSTEAGRDRCSGGPSPIPHLIAGGKRIA